MGLVNDISTAIETYIGSLLPDYSKSQFVWDASLNSDSKTRKYYSVRPGSADFVSGSCRTITVDQQFTVEFGDSFRNKKDSDQDADEKNLCFI
jgi:hypothetical protein